MFGDTVFLLEPDVKNGQGGYRDLLASLWAAKARFRVADFDELLALGQATPRQIAALTAARAFYLRLRTAAHLFARRRQDPCFSRSRRRSLPPSLPERRRIADVALRACCTSAIADVPRGSSLRLPPPSRS
ncbi:MAG: hypothetical protein EXR72_21215 [Myxococcales bacterium]|nr:hypothetical protein [Myxococcales bacterium]